MTIRRGQERQADREKDRFVQRLKAKPRSNDALPMEVVKGLLLEEQSEYLHEMLAEFKTLEESQGKIIEALAELARPKKWEFDIKRDHLTGLITSVEAHQLID